MAGALVFAAAYSVQRVPWGASAVQPDARVIVVDADRIRGLERDYTLANQRKAPEAEVRALVDKAVDDEILFREGIARGFALGDSAIAWRLVQKMRYLGEDHGDDVNTLYHRALDMGLHLSDPVVRQVLVEKVRLVIGRAAPRPTEAELQAWYAEHGPEFGQAERVTLRHVFFDRGRRGADGAHKAAEEASRKAVGQGPEAAAALGGDLFVMGRRLVGQSLGDLGKFFGDSFATQALSMPPAQWEGPVESSHGWHLVFIEERFDPRVPPLSEVRSRVEKTLDNERSLQLVDEYLRRIRPAYDVRVDDSAIAAGGQS